MRDKSLGEAHDSYQSMHEVSSPNYTTAMK